MNTATVSDTRNVASFAPIDRSLGSNRRAGKCGGPSGWNKGFVTDNTVIARARAPVNSDRLTQRQNALTWRHAKHDYVDQIRALSTWGEDTLITPKL
jgi:hypothetical protein